MKIISFTVATLVVLIMSCQKDSCTEKNNNNCACTLEYNPVCGCNKVTYSNACSAKCHGITNYTSGECVQ